MNIKNVFSKTASLLTLLGGTYITFDSAINFSRDYYQSLPEPMGGAGSFPVFLYALPGILMTAVVSTFFYFSGSTTTEFDKQNKDIERALEKLIKSES